MKITVVTVCYNAEKTIENTIKSVLSQTYADIEYLIIDGDSKDKTLSIICKYLSDERVKLISEKDSGLYNAMNKAIDYSTGSYIIYMNSGDIFNDCAVLEDISPYLQYDLVYGNAIRKTSAGDKLEKYNGKYKLMYLLLIGKMMSHQALFTKLDIMRQYQFDERFKICADYDFVVRTMRNHCYMKYIDRVVCVVDNTEGISSRISNYDLMRKEDDKSLMENFMYLYLLMKLPKGIVRILKRVKENKMKSL